MKGDNFKYNLIKWHFYLLAFILLNFGTEILIGYRLNQNLSIFFKSALYLSGIILFFNSIRPFKIISIYFSFYTITTVILVFIGSFFEILSSFFSYPIYPRQTEQRTETIKLYNRTQGFLNNCCSYEIVESKLYIFEKHLGFIKTDNLIDPNKDKLILNNKEIIYKYQIEDYNYETRTKVTRDKTEIFKF